MSSWSAAGLRAAIAAAETDARLRVAVISKVYPMRSHTVSAEGGAAAVIKPGDSLDEHAYDTISGGDWLCDQDAVAAFVSVRDPDGLWREHRKLLPSDGGAIAGKVAVAGAAAHDLAGLGMRGRPISSSATSAARRPGGRRGYWRNFDGDGSSAPLVGIVRDGLPSCPRGPAKDRDNPQNPTKAGVA